MDKVSGLCDSEVALRFRTGVIPSSLPLLLSARSYNVNQNPSDTDCCGPGMQPEWAWPKTWSGNFFPKLIFYTFSVEDNIFYPASGGGWEKSGRATASRDRGRGQTFLCFNSFVCLFVTLENMPHLPVKKSSTNPLI